MGSPEMFDHVLTAQGQLMWSYGPLSCRLYPVEGLDSGPNSAMSYMVQLGRHELLSLPRIRSLQEKKWDLFGKRLLYSRLLKHCSVLAVFQLGLMMPHVSTLPTLLSLFYTPKVILRLVCEFLVVSQVACARWDAACVLRCMNVFVCVLRRDAVHVGAWVRLRVCVSAYASACMCGRLREH